MGEKEIYREQGMDRVRPRVALGETQREGVLIHPSFNTVHHRESVGEKEIYRECVFTIYYYVIALMNPIKKNQN